MGFGLVNEYIDRLQVITTTNYNPIAISTLYTSQEHTVCCSQSVTRRFLVTVQQWPFLCLQLKSPLHRLLYRTDKGPDFRGYNILARTTWKTQFFYCCMSVSCGHYLEKAHCLQSHCLAMGLRTTVCFTLCTYIHRPSLCSLLS
jgi:hypothetical protein